MRLFSTTIYLPNRLNARRGQQRQYPLQASSLALIKLDLLIGSGIRGVVLDLDNTIISENDRYVSPGAEEWIEQGKQAGLKFYILSNGKRSHRVRYWSSRLKVPAINPAKKPFSWAFFRAIRHMQLTPQQVVVIGDSRHTDVLGAWLVGCPSIQVASLPHPPRWWEKLLGKHLQNPYPKELSLLDFRPSNYNEKLE
ncbi:YqeG family HAD IIIA-type phosphatase [filamentous cyanobacterium CCT1]|nr:YqeG family HAD IIIA-type phosphatase [filamentous cyanobacterium CCT1]PSN81096.1 YqeG family HAD IIIA-type phosphatase [filamentous cyanobacterium CCP4]